MEKSKKRKAESTPLSLKVKKVKSSPVVSLKAKKVKSSPVVSLKAKKVKSSAVVSLKAKKAKSSGEGAEAKPKAKRRRKKVISLKNKSWLPHVGSLLMLRCIQGALKKCHDYRENSVDIDWIEVRENVEITAEDIRTVWFLINKEFEGKSLEDIEWELKPYSSLSVERFVREETKLKFKDQMPKAPVSAFLLYSASVAQKFKEKYPHLNQRQIASKIGEKWKSLPKEKQMQFRSEYLTKREDYKKKLANFLEENPEAKVTAVTRRKTNKVKKTTEPSPETIKLKELRSLKPKAPTTAYMLFCKEKRPSYQKKHPDLSSREVTVKLSEKWKAIDETKKAKYRKQHIDDKCVYVEELKKFYESHPGSKELLARKRKSKRDTASNGPTQETASGNVSMGAPRVASTSATSSDSDSGEDDEEIKVSGVGTQQTDSDEDEEIQVSGVGTQRTTSGNVSMGTPRVASTSASSSDSDSDEDDEEIEVSGVGWP